MDFFEKKTEKSIFFGILIFLSVFLFKTDLCQSATVVGETSMAGMTLYLDKYYAASVKREAGTAAVGICSLSVPALKSARAAS